MVMQIKHHFRLTPAAKIVPAARKPKCHPQSTKHKLLSVNQSIAVWRFSHLDLRNWPKRFTYQTGDPYEVLRTNTGIATIRQRRVTDLPIFLRPLTPLPYYFKHPHNRHQTSLGSDFRVRHLPRSCTPLNNYPIKSTHIFSSSLPASTRAHLLHAYRSFQNYSARPTPGNRRAHNMGVLYRYKHSHITCTALKGAIVACRHRTHRQTPILRYRYRQSTQNQARSKESYRVVPEPCFQFHIKTKQSPGFYPQQLRISLYEYHTRPV
ncbi:hypothetical protein L873DRAFT_1114677 [Choiromyces venosus 120613-1]|uniref:Uncharacterized protein n=1 Tax=Choiromyces venosus 120613-1 TaxID=1336337 RepID=A0A3N4JV54_9PEZI|nr:hypothetical protein L873DRAFT_1114677 [Choiromyces venosus 120613-1]